VIYGALFAKACRNTLTKLDKWFGIVSSFVGFIFFI